jgi:hypothetical protein
MLERQTRAELDAVILKHTERYCQDCPIDIERLSRAELEAHTRLVVCDSDHRRG